MQSLLVYLTGAPAVGLGVLAFLISKTVGSYRLVLTLVLISSTLAGLSAVLTVSLIAYCVVMVSRHRQPHIRILSRLAARLAPGS